MATQSNKAPAIGIDLGTTYSCVGVFQHGNIEIIANDQGNRITPSYVAFTENGRLIGDAAKSQAAFNPENTVFDAKRLIGRRYDDPKIQDDIKHWPFTVVDESGRPKIKVEFKGENKLFSPEEVSAMVLTKMKETAEMYLEQKVTDAVITVPAYFNDSQRHATKDAGIIAGLNVLRIINEPTAAALAYGLDKDHDGVRNALIFDLGGGTFDVSILSIDKGPLFQVKATEGDTHLGGEDFDNRMVNYFVEEFKLKYDKDLSSSPRSLRRLRTACETAKRTLSSINETSIEVDALFDGIDFHMKITRAQFEKLCNDLFENTLETVKRALESAKMVKNDIQDIVIIGGSTRIPKIQKLLKDFFDGRELCSSINPDEAVAYGAATQAAVLSGDTSNKIKDLLLIDITPLSLGIETLGEIMTTLIQRNTRIPCAMAHNFTTVEDFQTSVNVRVFQGERAMTKDNHLLGEFLFSGVSSAPRRHPVIEVTFDIDADGILQVSSTDKSTGKSESICITSETGRLSKDEIERMLAEAKQYEEEDKEQKRRFLVRNHLEEHLYITRQTLIFDPENRLSSEEKQEIKNYCNAVSEWLQDNPQAERIEIENKDFEFQQHLLPFVRKVTENEQDTH